MILHNELMTQLRHADFFVVSPNFRVPCIYPGKNILFKITESSHFPYYLEFEIWYQQGNQDIIAVQLCEVNSKHCRSCRK
jgi:hypothetical protein